MNNKIETIEYKGFCVNIFPDYDYDTSMDDAMGALHCAGNDLYIGSIRVDGREVKAPISIEYSVSDFLEILKESHVFYGSYGSHSGVWLNAMRGEITAHEITCAAQDLYKKEHPTQEDREDQGYEDFIEETTLENLNIPDIDRQSANVLLIIPRDLWGEKQSAYEVAKKCWQYHNDVITGNVYGYTITDKDGDNVDDVEYVGGSCGGFVGNLYDYGDGVKDHDGYMIKDAKKIIESIDEKNYYTKKYKKQITEHENAINAINALKEKLA
jgi:hypothetical protein